MSIKERYSLALVELPKDLKLVGDGMRWCFNDGYWPRNSAEHPSRVSKPTDDDKVPGARFDTGLGNYRSREAFNIGRRLLKRAEVNLALALYGEGIKVQPKLSDANKYLQLVRSCEMRSSMLPESPRDSLCLSHAVEAYGVVWRIRSTVESATALRHEPYAVTLPQCPTCEIRASRTKQEGECDTCAQYRRRKGVARPRRLDKNLGHPYQEAVEAQERRAAIGSGFGGS
jgi:hypothetical protein